ncbi:endonuclease/exonuclease/phosphatase family protein [Deinococcus maricopensis]|uniref:Endonuclease/exonuclease/phosphatase n=1 Tax=Deinococcus maricopensis (strain DSM 21211 / LMG 22137 / NRRL B-23946 / LB-34) TaxID=709986 RepID=E8U3K3_DEIML|nr:endonuclease/exonuclease/phosphatase family protein [Deinococcus maricopensis]ADV68627.1 Endonuclease/exonuclease/phosphatase [Deinococcus maricopensis DSM 21211]
MSAGPVKFAWGLVAVLLAVWALTTFVAERTVPTLLLTYFVLPQVWLVPTVAALLLGAWRRDGRAVLGGAVATALALLLVGWEVPSPSPGSRSFRLMTYNIARGTGGAAELARVISRAEPDVVCLQETNTVLPGVLRDLERRLPGYAAARSREVVVLSRFPVTGVQDRALPDTTRRLLRATVRVRGQPVTLLNLHFTTVLWRGGWAGARDRRAAQVRAVLQVARQTRGPVVACGDFNTPPRGLVDAALREQFSNAFAQAGAGFGYTFPARAPLVRIDHVWLRRASAVAAFVPDARASDHRPLVVDVTLRR